MEGIARRIHLQEVDSTNDEARRRLDAGVVLPDVTLIDADGQSAGRGQRGNTWESAPACNLTFSLVFHPQRVRPAEQFVLSQAMALAVREALAGACPDWAGSFSVKWPNDIYYDDSKVCGTLIECDLQGGRIANCIIGTGINVNQPRFLSQVPNPVSLLQISGREHDREALLQVVAEGFVRLYRRIEQGDAEAVRRRYRELLYRREGLHPYADAQGLFMASIEDVERSGHLVLRREDGRCSRYEFKEVRIVL